MVLTTTTWYSDYSAGTSSMSSLSTPCSKCGGCGFLQFMCDWGDPIVATCDSCHGSGEHQSATRTTHPIASSSHSYDNDYDHQLQLLRQTEMEAQRQRDIQTQRIRLQQKEIEVQRQRQIEAQKQQTMEEEKERLCRDTMTKAHSNELDTPNVQTQTLSVIVKQIHELDTHPSTKTAPSSLPSTNKAEHPQSSIYSYPFTSEIANRLQLQLSSTKLHRDGLICIMREIEQIRGNGQSRAQQTISELNIIHQTVQQLLQDLMNQHSLHLDVKSAKHALSETSQPQDQLNTDANTNTDKDDLQSNNDQLQSKLTKSKKDLEFQSAQINELTMEYQKAIALKDEFEKKLTTITNDHHRLKHECDQLKPDNARLKSENADLQAMLSKSKKDTDPKTMQMNELKTQCLQAMEGKDEAEKKIATITDHNNHLKQQCDRLKSKNTDLQSEIRELENVHRYHKEQRELICKLRTPQLSEYSSALDLSRGFPPVQDIVNDFRILKSHYHVEARKPLKKALKQRHRGYHMLRNYKCVCEILFDILMKSYLAMKQFAEKTYSDIAMSNGLDIDNPKHMKRVERMVKEVYSGLVSKLKKDKARTILSEIKGVYKLDDCLKNDTKLLEYTEECIAICWMVALVRDPMLSIEPKQFDQSNNYKETCFDEQLYIEAFGSENNEPLNFVVWPSIVRQDTQYNISKITGVFVKKIPQWSKKKMKRMQAQKREQDEDTDKDEDKQTFMGTKRIKMKEEVEEKHDSNDKIHTHVRTFVEHSAVHIVSDDCMDDNASIDFNNMTEVELTNIVDSIEIEELTEALLEYVAHSKGMMEYSNRSDANYNAAFTCKSGDTTNSSHRVNGRDNHHDNNNNSDDSKQNDDNDDKKHDPDETHHLSFHGCNHLRECAECAAVFTRQCEHIKFLTQMLHRQQQQIEYNTSVQNMFCKVIQSRTSKSKSKLKSFAYESITESKTTHDLYASYRAKTNIKISRKMTGNMILKATNETISNGYAFVEKSIGIQFNDGQIQCDPNTKLQILNLDCYDECKNPLYCVMERMPPNKANYKWQIHDKLYTGFQAMQLCGGALPHSSRFHLQGISARDDLTQFKFDLQVIRRVIKQCKWNTITVFKRKENKQRLTLSITHEQLNPMIRRSMLNIQNDSTRLIPILMFDNASNSHWIEYILVVHMKDDIDIGIALRYNITNGVRITGIHLDKQMILEQHEVLLSHGKDECHCLDGFTSIINDMSVGNCDAVMNEMKNYKQKYRDFKLLVLKFINGKDTEKYDILQQHAEMVVKHDNGSLGYSLVSDSPHPNSTSHSSSPSSPNCYGLQSPESLSSSSDNINRFNGQNSSRPNSLI